MLTFGAFFTPIITIWRDMVPPGTHFSNVAVERTIPVKFEIMMAAESATNPGINLQPLWMANATRWCEPIDSKHIFLTSSSSSASNFAVHYFDNEAKYLCTSRCNCEGGRCKGKGSSSSR